MRKGLLLILMLCLTAASYSLNAQVLTDIEELNADLDNFNNQLVTLSGIYVNDGKNAELWVNSYEPRENHRYNWAYHIRLAEGLIPVPPKNINQMDSIQVTGTVRIVDFDYPYIGNPSIAEIVLDSYIVIKKKTKIGMGGVIGPSPLPPANCDSCKFAIFVCGFDSPDYWNDLTQKYDYKTGTHNVCPDNIVVLYKGGSNDTNKIPDGSASGANFTSGGVHDCNKANIKKAFDYIKAKMKASNCQPAEFQFHTTGHGGGYHTSTNQGHGNKPRGIVGGRLDSSGDESRKINENDIVFYYRGIHDIDGDGVGDIKVELIPNPNPPPPRLKKVMHDSNGDGTFDKLIGIDYNEDGRVDKNDSAWTAPDLDRNGEINDVGWDDVLHLGGGESLTDDELRGHIQELIDSTGLNKENSRAELSQCFSGSFNRDLRSVTTESSSACGEGEVSYSSGRDSNDYNIYQKYFIDRLNAGRTWTEAHNDAVDSIINRGTKQNPQYTDHSGECLEMIGPYMKGSQVCIKITNVCGTPRPVDIKLSSHNFGLATDRVGGVDSTTVLKNGESIEICINKPTETGTYCFWGRFYSFEPDYKSLSKWHNNVSIEASTENAMISANYSVGGSDEVEYSNIFLIPNLEKTTPGWEFNLSAYQYDLTQGEQPMQQIDIFIPPDAMPGDMATIYIEAFATPDMTDYVSYMQFDIEITEPIGPEEYKATYPGGVWNLASIPLEPAQMELSSSFPDLVSAFTYEPEIGYMETNNYMPGKGFWLLLEEGGEYPIAGNISPNNIYPLQAGWNVLQGLPFNRAMVSLLDGNEVETMFAYSPEDGYYESMVILEGSSNWIYVPNATEAELMPVKGGIISTLTNLPQETNISIIGEAMPAYTNTASVKFGIDTLGMMSTKAPPATPQHTADIKLYDIDDTGTPINTALFRSIKNTQIPKNDTIRWVLEVDPNGNIPFNPDKTATLTWDSAGLYNDGIYEHKWKLCSGIVTSGVQNIIVDDMMASSTYTLSGANNMYYTIVYIQNIPSSINENKLSAEQYNLSVSPMPFSEQAEISFTLPQYAEVEAEVFDALGESIYKFEPATMLSGKAKLIWFGENHQGREAPTGTYYFRIKIISNEGYKVISGKLIKL